MNFLNLFPNQYLRPFVPTQKEIREIISYTSFGLTTLLPNKHDLFPLLLPYQNREWPFAYHELPTPNQKQRLHPVRRLYKSKEAKLSHYHLKTQLADGPPLETPSLIFPSLREASLTTQLRSAALSSADRR
ncbi:hypothetical protein CEXT_197071 [Caerostris extrusa]|uniref:Uncharacterized protein n=1 Tax=Caerostris extrusa TaxID=172846 RepID=A0AAV4S4X5_CAEEX|nr:hypothetical protein CEXT_197071 [Caerostris extrusa]